MRSRRSEPRRAIEAGRRKSFRASVERLETRRLLAAFVVTNTNDSGPGSLRQAITAANANPGADNIDFGIPASTAPDQNIPVPGFDPESQTWRITLQSPLPAITDTVTIDGYTQAHSPIPYRYPSGTTQTLSLTGSPTGGTFTLTTQAPLPVRTTDPIPFDANTAQVLAALNDILGVGNVFVSGGPALPNNEMSVQFIGQYADVAAPPMVGTSMLTGGSNPGVSVETTASGDPVQITSTANTIPAIDGNNAAIRVIVDGSQTTGATGFVLNASHSNLRGLIIDGFDVGVSVPNPGNVGNLIQGNYIGRYYLFMVDLASGQPIVGPGRVVYAGQGNARQGVLLGSTNATVGGASPQANNVIVGNGAQGVSILAGAEGNQVLGNQIGIAGPTINGRFVIDPNGAEGVLVAASSNTVGGNVGGAGNLISGNASHGVRIVGSSATRNNVEGNYIGIGPGGGFLFGAEGTGNSGDGIRIEDALRNQVGGPGQAQRNVISANNGAGVRILGASSVGNEILGNIIGLTANGSSARGNALEGVVVASPENVVGPGNVLSANLRGVLLIGPSATGNRVVDNLIGTDITGLGDLGNAVEGVRIEGARGNVVSGNGQGSQVISGNNVGLLLIGAGATGNQVVGNFIGTDISGLRDRGNSQEGVRIENAPANTVGGTTAATRNLISANHWGVVIAGGSAVNNVVQGNFIGPDITGTAPPGRGNELDGVLVRDSASGNLIGGSTTPAGNTIAFNIRDGVRVEGPSVRNAILTNAIFANGALGIDLFVPADPGSGVTPNDPTDVDSGPNNLQNHPILTSVATSIAFTNVQGTLVSAPNTTYTIQFFANASLDPSGQGEGERFLGEITTRTNADGVATFSADVPATVPAGQFVTATATDPLGNTSEFSPGLAEVLGTVQFTMSAYVALESSGLATITVTRSGGSGGLFTVQYATSDGTARAGVDYEAASGTLTFDPGVNAQTFTITLLGDTLPEADETILLTLSNPAGAATLGTPNTAVLTIVDDDQPGALSFSMAGYAANEDDGFATITVVRDGGGGEVSVDYATSNGTALAGVNYVATSGTLVFGVGETSKSFVVPLLLNPAVQGDLSVLLTLSDPAGGATLGSPSSAVLIIKDDTADRDGPRVVSLRAFSGPPGAASVVLAFDQPLIPSRAEDLLNYGYSVRTPGRDRRFGTADDILIGLRAAVYDPTRATVTLIPTLTIHRGMRVQVIINEVTDIPDAGRGVADLAGNLLDGNNDGRPGGVYSATVTASPAPRRPPGAGNRVVVGDPNRLSGASSPVRQRRPGPPRR